MTNNPRFLTLTAVLLFLGSSFLRAESIADIPENRQQQAQRYLEATAPKGIASDIVEEVVMGVPPADRERFKESFLAKIDKDAVIKVLKESLTKRFTAEELKALADFYGSPVGKSALSKLSAYMEDIMPVVQTEVGKAVTKAKQAMEKK